MPCEGESRVAKGESKLSKEGLLFAKRERGGGGRKSAMGSRMLKGQFLAAAAMTTISNFQGCLPARLFGRQRRSAGWAGCTSGKGARDIVIFHAVARVGKS